MKEIRLQPGSGSGIRAGMWSAVVGVLGAALLLTLGTSRPLAAPPEKPEASEPETVASRALVRLDFIDEEIKSAWDENKIKPSRFASDEEFLRRVYLDIIGRIPNVSEAQGFLSAKDKGKRQKLVDYLLENPDYPKNFANIWTVTLIGRKAQERQVDRGALNAWIRRQFNENRPWDKIVFELITAKGNNKENGAVNFPLAHMENGAVPLTSVTTRAFLGQQIQCTQCHDHPSNDWKQPDFWGINAFFKGMRREDVNKADATGADVYDHTDLSDQPTDAFAQFDKRNAMVGIAFPRYLDGRKISQGTDVDRRLELGKLIADAKNADMAKSFVNRMWGHFLGRGIVHPVDDFGAHNPPSHPELLDKLAAEFQKSNFDIKALIRWITASQAYNLSSQATKANEKDETLFSHLQLKPMSPEQLFDSLLAATNAHKAGGDKGAEAKRDAWLKQFVFAFATDEDTESSNFQGTIPQALMMMNGEMMDKATSCKPGSFLYDLLERAQRSSHPAEYMVNNLYLAALSRHPTAHEMNGAAAYVKSYPDALNFLEDLFWALLNSNEFVLIH